MADLDPKVTREIRKVEGVLEEIRANTSTPWWRSIMNGSLYGAGAVVGTVFAIAILGWLLSIFHIIPGLGEIAARLQQAMNGRSF